MMTLQRAIQVLKKTNMNCAQRLSFLNVLYERQHDDTALQLRLDLHNAVRVLAEEGKIAIVWSGRDCDGVEYSNQVSVVAADWRVVQEYVNKEYDSAEGPLHYGFMKPSEAKKLKYESRDLVMEAFENGHPHVIHPHH